MMPAENSRTYRPATAGLMDQLDATRIRHGLTRTELAHQAGISTRTVIQALTTGRAQLHTVLALCEALDLDLHTVSRPGTSRSGRPRHPHGTIAAVARHRRGKEALCVRCRAADAQRKRLSRAAARTGVVQSEADRKDAA